MNTESLAKPLGLDLKLQLGATVLVTIKEMLISRVSGQRVRNCYPEATRGSLHLEPGSVQSRKGELARAEDIL